MYTRTTGIKVDDKKIIGKHISTESRNKIASSFNDYYKSITLTDRKDAITSAIEDDNMKNTITIDNKGKKQIYSKHVLTKNSKFGKPSLDHTFTSEACFEHVLIFILKNKYLSNQDKHALFKVHPLFYHLYKMMNWSKHIQFAELRNPIKNYSKQISINTTRIQQMLAVFLNYDLDIPTVIRFLGNNYTGEYRKTSDIVSILKDTGCDNEIISDLQRLFQVGAPNKLNAESTHNNFLQFFRYGNHSSIQKKQQENFTSNE